MDIPGQHKPNHRLGLFLVFLLGLVIGSIVISYIYFLVKDRLCIVSQSPVISTTLTATQIQQAASVTEDRTVFGKVTSIDASSFTMLIPVVNPLDSKNSTTTSVRVTFDPVTDEVIIPKPSATSVEQVKATFGDIKIGQQILLKILNGKKTVYIPTS